MGEQAPNSLAFWWRRPLALFVDLFLLCLLGHIVISLFYDFLLAHRAFATWTGFVISTCYFSFFESTFGNGQTPGKRLFHLQVVNREGQTLHFAKSVMRCLVFEGWFFVSLRYLPNITSEFDYPVASPGMMIVIAAYFGWIPAALYLYLANRRTRQTFHDIASASYVRRINKAWSPPLPGVNRIHFIVIAVWLIVLVDGGLAGEKYLDTLTPDSNSGQFALITKVLSTDPDIYNASVSLEGNSTKAATNALSQKTLSVVVQYDKKIAAQGGLFSTLASGFMDPDYQKKIIAGEPALREIGAKVLATDPTAVGSQWLNIQIDSGVDLVIASSYNHANATETPDVWKKIISGQTVRPDGMEKHLTLRRQGTIS